METLEEARDMILKELTSDDAEVRAEYLSMFGDVAKEFAGLMAEAFLKWRAFDATIKKEDEARAHVSALIYMAVTLHVLSMKLFLSGHAVAAGNLFRQVVESIALALLCSGGKALTVLESFMADKYSSQVAVRDVLKHGKKHLSLKAEGLEALGKAQEFYHKYSHISKLTIASGMSFSEPAQYVGASFDKGKIDAYKKEVQGRVSLAKVFPNFIDGVAANVAKW